MFFGIFEDFSKVKICKLTMPFSFLCFLAFSVPFSNHALRDFKEEISNNLRQLDSYINTSDGLFPLPNTPHGKL